MEMAAAFLESLLDTASAASKDEGIKLGGNPEKLFDALAEDQESVFATLLDLLGGQLPQNFETGELFNSLVSESSGDGISLEAMTGLLKNNKVLLSDSAPLTDLLESSLESENSAGNGIPLLKLPLSTKEKTSKEGINNPILAKVLTSVPQKTVETPENNVTVEKGAAHEVKSSPIELGTNSAKNGDLKTASEMVKDPVPPKETFVEKVKTDDPLQNNVKENELTKQTPDTPKSPIPIESKPVLQKDEAEKVKSETVPPGRLSTSKIREPEVLQPAKTTQNSGQETEKTTEKIEIKGKEPLFQSEPGKKQAGHSKETTEVHRTSMPQKQSGTDSPLNNNMFKIGEESTGRMATFKGEKLEGHKEVQGDGGKVNKEDVLPNLTRETLAGNTNQSSEKKHLNIASSKPDTFDQGVSASRVIKIDSASGEGSVFSNNHHNTDKSSETSVLPREAQTVPKSIQSDVMSQLVEKAVLNLKNGQTSMNISLKPNVLGHLKMQVTTDNNQVMIRILTELPLVKEMVESNLSSLRTELQNHGLEIHKFDVSLDHGLNQKDNAPQNFPFWKMTDRENGDDKDKEVFEESPDRSQIKQGPINENLIDFFA